VLTIDQYNFLSKIRERTDSVGKVYIAIPTKENWKLLNETDFIERKDGRFSTITFQGRVALAAYEDNNADN